MNNILLIDPKIPQNTGNIARTCVANGFELHLAGDIGFSLDDKYLKRAGLDYWKDLNLFVHNTYEEYLDFETKRSSNFDIFYFTKFAKKTLYQVTFKKTMTTLVFGSEIKGIPKYILNNNLKSCVKIPMLTKNVRALNLSNCVAIATYELIRQRL